MGSGSRHDGQWFAGARKLGFELAIVFLGVLAAFQVDNYRDDLADRERARDIAAAIQRGLDDVIDAESRFVAQARAGRAAWDEARERGEMPAPFYFRIPGSERPPSIVFDVVAQSQPAELFDADLVFDLGYFYSEVAGVGERYVRYAGFTEAKILPNLYRDANAFYDPDSGELLPEYAAHMDRLEELVGWWTLDIERARDLKKRLQPYAE